MIRVTIVDHLYIGANWALGLVAPSLARRWAINYEGRRIGRALSRAIRGLEK